MEITIGNAIQIGALLLSAGAMLQRLNALQKQVQKLEEKVEELTHELTQQKIENAKLMTRFERSEH